MHTYTRILGIDIGSVSVAMARLVGDNVLDRTDYEFHHGEVRLAKMGDAAEGCLKV